MRSRRFARGACALSVVFALAFLTSAHAGSADTIDARRNAWLDHIVKLELQQGPVKTWVDSYRWSIAHACLMRGVRLNEANRYLSEVTWASLSRGLIFDTDVQVTDLIRTYLEFRDDDRLSPAAKAHLKRMLTEWRVPHPDRNRDADRAYEWPDEYTENHSLNILVGAYLIDHALGRDRTLHKGLLERFLGDRARWGWSEFNSVRYGMVTAKALVLLADFAPDASLQTAGKMYLDLLAIQFSTRCLNYWQGVPCSRGGSLSPTHDAFEPAARLWFGDPDPKAAYTGADHIVHFLASSYRPPRVATTLHDDPVARGRCVYTQVATSGAAKLRVPIVVYVSPYVTMAAAQGSGSYYDGRYASIRFASGRDRAVTCSYGGQRTMFQHGNVLATFGTVDWHGEFTRESRGNFSVAGDGNAYVGQVDLAEGCHLLMVADKDQYEDLTKFAAALTGLEPAFQDGVLTWRTPEGQTVRMVNKKMDDRWRFVEAFVDDVPVRIDRNLLFDSPYTRSVRDSKIVEVALGGRKWAMDFRDDAAPQIRAAEEAALTALPADTLAGPAGIEWVYIPAGEFVLGSPAGEGRANERPQRWVRVDGFYISKTEVTAGQYRAYLEDNPGRPQPPPWLWQEWGKTAEYPMTWVSWDEAADFCKWLSKKTGAACRLPTEAEWEKAATGFAHQPHPWGEGYDGSQSGSPNETYLPVKSKLMDRSPFGVMDMAGNAWEWCADWYDKNAYAAATDANPTGPATGVMRVVRGCGWNYDPDTFRVSYRTSFGPDQRSVHVGFRVVRELKPWP